MISFIEGGMTVPIGTITRNYLRFFRLSPTQCALNMFRILGSVEALNERMNLGLTHYDVNWVYSLHHLKRQGYYLKSRYLKVRLIKCLPTSNKGLKKDFLIFFGGWHDGLPCSTREGTPSGGPVINFCTLAHVFLLFRAILLLTNSYSLSMIFQRDILPHLSSTWSTNKAQTKFYSPRCS